MAAPRHPYLDLVLRRAPAAAAAWFDARYTGVTRESFGVAYAGAGRRLGMEPVTPAAAEVLELESSGLPVPSGWPLSAVGRALLLVRLCEQVPDAEHVASLEQVFRTGDNAERQALLRALVLLPAPERFVEIAIDACRSHVQSVFEAVACDNPYPARFFPDHNFNQLVLKALFTEVPAARIAGLAGRRSPELSRMAEAYASERRAAGRSVPADLHVVTGVAASAVPELDSRSSGAKP